MRKKPLYVIYIALIVLLLAGILTAWARQHTPVIQPGDVDRIELQELELVDAGDPEDPKKKELSPSASNTLTQAEDIEGLMETLSGFQLLNINQAMSGQRRLEITCWGGEEIIWTLTVDSDGVAVSSQWGKGCRLIAGAFDYEALAAWLDV